MKKPSHRDRLIASLPADLQAGAMEACHAFSDDGNDAIEGLFAADIATTQRGFADQKEQTQRGTAQLREEIRMLREKLAESDEKLRVKLAESEERGKQLPAHITKCHTETQKNLRAEFQNLTGDLPWWRGKIKTAVNGIVWVTSVAVATMVVEHARDKKEITPMKEAVADLRAITKELADDPKSLAEFVKYTKEANSEALTTAISLQAIAKLMTLPKIQVARSDDGYAIIYGPKSTMPVGTTEDGRNWVKLANPVARVSPNSTPAIDNAKEAEKKLNPSE